MSIRLTALTVLLVAVAFSCDGGNSGVLNESGANSELAQAIDAALTDCQDPLHDSDGSGGFFEFCDRIDEAKAARRLDCVRASGDATIDADCADWTLDRSQVPPQYFIAEPASNGDETEQPDVAPADAMPEPIIDAITGFPVDMKILEWTEFGGCDWGALNCRFYVVFGDGRVEASRGADVLAIGAVDRALVRALIDASDIDTSALTSSLPLGPCLAAVDGVSHEIWIGPADLRIDSCEVDISGDEPLIAAARELGMAAEIAAPLE